MKPQDLVKKGTSLVPRLMASAFPSLIINMKRAYAVTLSAVCFMACQSPAPMDERTIVANIPKQMDEYVSFAPAIKSVEAIELKLPEPYFFGICSEVQTWGDDYFCRDEKQSVIFRFDHQGRFLNTIGRRGPGPGEYLSLKSFCVKDSCVYICDMEGTGSIHTYTVEGKHLNTVRLERSNIISSFAALPGNRFLCHLLYDATHTFKGIWIMDKEGKCEKRLLEYAPGEYVHSSWNTITAYEDGTIELYNAADGRFYRFDHRNDTVYEACRLISNRNTLLDIKVDNRERLMSTDLNYACAHFSKNGDNYIISYWCVYPDNRIAWTVTRKSDKSTRIGTFPFIDVPGYTKTGRPVSSNIPNAYVCLYTDELNKKSLPDAYQEKGLSEGTAVLAIMHLN